MIHLLLNNFALEINKNDRFIRDDMPVIFFNVNILILQ